MISRRATNEEIKHYYRHFNRVQYRHFLREVSDCRTATGVRHIRYSNSKLYLENDTPCVRYQGKLEPVRASVRQLPSGAEVLHDLRIDSDYLDR